MNYRQLGRSGLQVSCMGLGGSNFGDLIDEKQAAAVIHQAVDLGISYFDTSNTYGNGLSEEYIGKAVKGLRGEVVIATKFGRLRRHSPVRSLSRPSVVEGASRHTIRRAVEQSLRRLGTDYIDLYQVHFWDPYTPIDETMRALDDLVRQGKVLYIGCSVFAAWQVGEAASVARTLNMTRLTSCMAEYNLLCRDIERELLPCCQAHGIGIIPFYPLASGLLTGKYRRGQSPPPGTRLAASTQVPEESWTPRKRQFLSIVGEHLHRRMTLGNLDLVERLGTFARERQHTLAELAIAWLLANPDVSTVIPGATRPQQVVDNVRASEWRLTPEDLSALDAVLHDAAQREAALETTA